MKTVDPIRPTDEAARRLARDLLAGATFAALGVTNPETGAPSVTRIALALDPERMPLTLISDLSSHTVALRAAPRASLLVGEPADKGDPLTHPRLTIDVRAAFLPRTAPDYETLRDHWVTERPKSKLYVDFTDFHLCRLTPLGALLNGGFGKAYRLDPEDLA